MMEVIPEQIDFFDLLADMDTECDRIGWDINDLKKYVLKTYHKKSRHLLTDQQLWELYCFLRSHKKVASSKKIGLKKIGLKLWKK